MCRPLSVHIAATAVAEAPESNLLQMGESGKSERYSASWMGPVHLPRESAATAIHKTLDKVSQTDLRERVNTVTTGIAFDAII